MLALIAAFGGGYYQGNESGQATVQQKWDKENARLQAEYAENQRIAREKEQALQASADKLRQEKDREIRNINARATALSNSLRDRPERPAKAGAVSGAASTCVGASGKELARGDGEFLSGYAADAARLQAALNQCIAQYEEVRTKR
ncbi:MAG: hypothetical protein ACK42H_19290 [Planctomycetota bacterium]